MPQEPEGILAFSAMVEDNMELYLIPDMSALGLEPIRLTFDPGNDFDVALSPDGQTLAFVSDRDGYLDIYLLRVDTGNVENITNTPRESEGDPAWSPDGRRLAYVAGIQEGLEVFVVNADGTDVRQLTEDSTMDRHPAWSPDGAQIAFTSDPSDTGGRELEIYVMNADGSNRHRLTDTPGADEHPSWSPDGAEIVYVRNALYTAGNLAILDVEQASATGGRSGSRQLTAGPADFEPVWHGPFIAYATREGSGPNHIRIITSDGVEVRRIEASLVSDRGPTWVSGTSQLAQALPTALPTGTTSPTNTPTPSAPSPDGRLVFVSSRDGNNELYLVDYGGITLENRLTFDPADDHRPALAPDGQTLAFVSDRDGNDEIYLMQIGQLGLHRLTENRAEDGDPAWSPDGQWIAFRSQRDGNNELYRMRPDGSDLTRLTNYPGDDLAPAWSPDGAQIAFMSARDRNLELYLMRADGSDVRRQTDNPGVDGYPSWSPDGRRIAFHSARDAGVDIYLLDLEAALPNSSSEGITRFSSNPEEDRVPVWHGEFLAYMSVLDGDFDIVVTNRAGEVVDRFGSPGDFDGFPTWASLGEVAVEVPQLGTEARTTVLFPSQDPADPRVSYGNFLWSPDGRWVAFTRASSDSRFQDVLLMPADCAGQVDGCHDEWKVVTNAADSGADYIEMAWSPDGRRLAVTYLDARDFFGIALAELGASGNLKVTANPVGLSSDGSAAWAPRKVSWLTTSQLVFHLESNDPQLPSGIYQMNPDGSGLRLIRPGASNPWPSPDGAKIAYVATGEEDYNPSWWLLDRFKGTTIQLEDPEYYAAGDNSVTGDFTAAWSPDNQWLALDTFLVFPGADVWPQGIFLVRTDGQGLVDLTSVDGVYDNGGEAAWSPDGRYLAFTSFTFCAYQDTPCEYFDVFVIRRDGEGLLKLTSSAEYDHFGFPQWSLDGRTLYYNGPEGLYRVDIGALP